MKLLRRMNKSNNRKNSGFTLVELVIVMAIMGILGLAVVGFIGTSTKQYKYASKDVDLQYEAQLTMNQIGDLIIDAQKGVKYEPATVAAPVEVASANPETGYIATASASAEEGNIIRQQADYLQQGLYILYHIQTVRAQNLSAKGYTGSCNRCGEGGWSGQGISYGRKCHRLYT